MPKNPREQNKASRVSTMGRTCTHRVGDMGFFIPPVYVHDGLVGSPVNLGRMPLPSSMCPRKKKNDNRVIATWTACARWRQDGAVQVLAKMAMTESRRAPPSVPFPSRRYKLGLRLCEHICCSVPGVSWRRRCAPVCRGLVPLRMFGNGRSWTSRIYISFFLILHC